MNDSAHIIVLGNEKGGSGKSTTAMHVAIGLMRLGYRVASIDLDARQGTLTRYMANRFSFAAQSGQNLPIPTHLPIEKTGSDQDDEVFLTLALAELRPAHDFVVIDTPGSDIFLNRLAHSYADTLITPMNDSFVDLDVLARLDPHTQEILGPSVYTKMVNEQREIQKARSGTDIQNWIVMRNRLSALDAKNKRDVGRKLEDIAQRFGISLATGFGERVIFRELFPKGLTLLDLREDGEQKMTLSAISARQEVRQLLTLIGPEKIKGYPQQKRV